MRIVHVVHQYLPDAVGGTELYTQQLARELARLGHATAVFTVAPLAPESPRLEDGVRVYRVEAGVRSPTAVFLNGLRQPDMLAAFEQTLAAERPDVVHVQHLMGLPAELVDVARRQGTAVVVTLHDYWYVCANAQLITNYDNTICAGPKAWVNCGRCGLARAGRDVWPLAPALAPLMAARNLRLRRVLDRAAAVVSPSAFTRDVYARLGVHAGRIRVIPHGIDVPAALPPRVPHDEFHIGYVGGIAWQKGVDVLVEAVNRFGANTAVRLSVFGDMAAFPDYTAVLRAAARHPGIQFKGRIPHAALWTALAGLDVLVVPTRWYETSSLIVQEAHAAGVPVVASDIGVLRERVRDGVDGRLFAPGDAAALYAILRELAGDTAHLARLRAGIGPVRTLDDHVADMVALYASVA